MNSVFKDKICSYCKKKECKNSILESLSNSLLIYKCEEYEKDSSKIIPYEEPLYPTIKRGNNLYIER